MQIQSGITNTLEANLEKMIKEFVSKGTPEALNAIAEQLKQVKSENLIEIFKKSPHTLRDIAEAAWKVHPNALNALAGKLTTIEKDDLIKIFKDSPHTLNNIAVAACKEHPNALNALAVNTPMKTDNYRKRRFD